MKVKVFIFATPWTIARQDPLSIGFSRQEYWRGLPFPSPGDLPDPGIKLGSPTLQADSLLSEPLCMHACMLSHFSCAQLFATQGTTIRQTPLSLGFSRQEYGNGLPCPSPEYLPDPGIKPTSLLSPALAGRFFTTSATWGATELPYRVLNPGEPISKPTALQCYHSWQASSILQLALALPSL